MSDPNPGIPFEGSEVPFGQLINLCALALDTDQGSLPSERLIWAVTGQESFPATGSLQQLDALEPGDYNVDVNAMDDDGLNGNVSLNFTVGPVVVPALFEDIRELCARCRLQTTSSCCGQRLW